MRPFDLSLKGLLAQAAKVIGGIDGRVVRSVRALVAQPGSLTQAYVEGRRKPFVGPFQLFLLANLAFFAAQSLSRTKIFSSTLDSHLHRQDWSGLAQAMVARRLPRGPARPLAPILTRPWSERESCHLLSALRPGARPVAGAPGAYGQAVRAAPYAFSCCFCV